jgi:hypothetical protein
MKVTFNKQKFLKPLLDFQKQSSKLKSLQQTKSFRKLKATEIELLEKNSNRCDQWELILVHKQFNAENIHNVVFKGNIYLGKFSKTFLISGVPFKSGLNHCVLSNVFIGNDCIVENAGLIHNVILGQEVIIRNCSSISCETQWSQLIKIRLGNELGGRDTTVFPNIDYETVSKSIMERSPEFQKKINQALRSIKNHSLSVSIIESYSQLLNCNLLNNFFLGEGSQLNGCLELSDSIILSKKNNPVKLLSGTIIRKSIVQIGTTIDSSAMIDTSYLSEASSASHKAIICDSVIGSNTHVEKGEVTSCLLGPFVGLHHQSLAISLLWPSGMGNIGYGAMLGSNHSGKVPDQECVLAEGTFFGLGASIKFPANLALAPYTLVSSSVEIPPQKIELPFSLLTKTNDELNEIVPGWVWRHNRYMLKRNQIKYQTRNKSTKILDTDFLRPQIIDCALHGLNILKSIKQKRIELYENKETIGQNILTPHNLDEGIQTYKDIVEFYCLRSFYDLYKNNNLKRKSLENLLKTTDARTNWQHAKKHFKEFVEPTDSNDILELYLKRLKDELSSVEKSKNRDLKRGRLIFDDYELVHTSTKDDETVKMLKAKIAIIGLEIL